LPERVRARASDVPRSSHPTLVETPKRPWRKTDDESEFESLVAALREHGGSVVKAAAAIGMGRARAYRLLSAHPDFSLEDLRQ
jgi:hypothetical protein